MGEQVGGRVYHNLGGEAERVPALSIVRRHCPPQHPRRTLLKAEHGLKGGVAVDDGARLVDADQAKLLDAVGQPELEHAAAIAWLR